jgi:N12 class adenine-specific DNA methylase
MSKQTAVEFLIKAFQGAYGEKVINVISVQVEKAKAMEKEQIINTFKDAQVFKVMNDETRAEQYYNETYNNET